MLNLFRMELRKNFRSKDYYVVLSVFMVFIFIALVSMKLVSDPALVQKAADAGFVFDSSDVQDAADFLKTSQTDFLGNLLFSGGLMACLTAIMSAIVVIGDFTSGFCKNIFSYYANRMDYLVSKLLLLAAVLGAYQLCLTACSLFLFRVMGFPNPFGSLRQCLIMSGLGWLGCVAIAAQTLFLSMLLKRTVFTCMVGVILAMGTAAGVFELLANVFGLHICWLFPSYITMMAPYACNDSFAFSNTPIISVFDNPSSQQNPLVSVLLLLAWIAFYLFLAGRILKKRDIC